MRTSEDCLRRAALADMYAARVEFQMAKQRLHEIAAWWRSQAAESSHGETPSSADLYSGRPN
jgi:hypothetical protein